MLFQPELFVGAGYTDNALLVDTAESNESLIYRMGAHLPFTRTYPGGRFTFSYSPTYERFQDFEELDNLNHRAALGVTGKPSERSNIGLRARYARLQDDRTANRRRPIVFLRQPLSRELGAVDLTFGRKFAQRWKWKGGVGYSQWRFEPIEEDVPETVPPEEELPPELLEDKREARARLGLSWALDSGFSIGGEYGIRRFDLDVTGEETAHLVSLIVDHTVKNRFKASFGVGGYLTEDSSEEPIDPVDPVDPAASEDESDTGAQGWLTLSRTYDQDTSKNTLTLTLTHRPHIGGTELGTSELSTAALGVDGKVGDAWFWSLFGRYARRDPTLALEGLIESFGADGYVERRIRRVVGLRLGAGYVDQTADNPEREGEVFRGNFTVVLYPLGQTRLGGYTPPRSDSGSP